MREAPPTCSIRARSKQRLTKTLKKLQSYKAAPA
jgi:hypothetical protein